MVSIISVSDYVRAKAQVDLEIDEWLRRRIKRIRRELNDLRKVN